MFARARILENARTAKTSFSCEQTATSGRQLNVDSESPVRIHRDCHKVRAGRSRQAFTEWPRLAKTSMWKAKPKLQCFRLHLTAGTHRQTWTPYFTLANPFGSGNHALKQRPYLLTERVPDELEGASGRRRSKPGVPNAENRGYY